MVFMLNTIIAKALTEFTSFIKGSGWRGKENDCVNLFAHRFLAKRIRPLNRIGIEVAVPQIGGKGRKQAVRKDLVIWKRSGQNTWGNDWNAKAVPQAILEWKARRGGRFKGNHFSPGSGLAKGF
jgi:hypothetical protein